MNLMDLLDATFGGFDTEEKHSHKCPEPDCGFVWSHSAAQIADADCNNNTAHTCPACGQGQSFSWYEGPERAECEFYGQKLNAATRRALSRQNALRTA